MQKSRSSESANYPENNPTRLLISSNLKTRPTNVEVVNAYIQRIHAMDGSGSLMQSKSERFADKKIESKTKTGTNIKRKAKKETINLANKCEGK